MSALEVKIVTITDKPLGCDKASLAQKYIKKAQHSRCLTYLLANGKLRQALVDTLRGLSRGLFAAEGEKMVTDSSAQDSMTKTEQSGTTCWHSQVAAKQVSAANLSFAL